MAKKSRADENLTDTKPTVHRSAIAGRSVGRQARNAPLAAMTRRVAAIDERLAEEFPEAACALQFESPLQLLVATILSAQCTDVRVNMVTPTLFAEFPTARDFADVPQEVLEDRIHSTGFFRNKAKNIIATCREIVRHHGGEVPADFDLLTSLPGVGRKTANCVLGNGFGIAEGFVVDTHVIRLSRRLGLVPPDEKNPERIEAVLTQLVPQEHWIRFSHELILHGRRTCNARRPDCEHCCIAEWCSSAKMEEKPGKK